MTILITERRKQIYGAILFISVILFIRNNWKITPNGPSPIDDLVSFEMDGDQYPEIPTEHTHEQGLQYTNDIIEDTRKPTTISYEKDADNINEVTRTPTTIAYDNAAFTGYPDGRTLNLTDTWKSPVCSWQTRREVMRRACEKGGWNDEVIDWTEMAGHYIIVDEKHKVLYCMIPKTASHSFRYLFGNLAIGKLESDMLYPIRNYLKHTGFKFLHDFRKVEDRQRILRDYFKMLVVRHPFDRLRSTFQNKLIAPGGLNYQVTFRSIDVITQYLVRRGRLEQGTVFDPYKHNITFQDFLYLVANKYQESFVDEHWKPFDRHCRPCVIQYDYIFHMETIKDDIGILYDYLEKMEPKVVRELSQENVDIYVQTLEEKLGMTTDAFAGISRQVIDDLLKVYEKDFAMFGYQWDHTSGAACEIHKTDDGSESCC